MLPSRIEKNMVIPIKVVKGEFYYFYGGRLPDLPDGMICDLIVPAWSIVDKEFLAKLANVQMEELLSIDAKIFTAVSSRHVPKDFTKLALSPKQLEQRFRGSLGKDIHWGLIANNPDSLFVEVILEEPLLLELLGTKQSRLRPVSCVIPGLGYEKAASLNHAYRLISEKFEPDRISHVGNVFHKMVYLDDHGVVFPLHDLRARLKAKHERALKHPGLTPGEYLGPDFGPEQPA